MTDIYKIDSHKLFWHLDRVCEWQQRRLIPPIYVEISPVSYCNHNCIFCGMDFAKKNGLSMNTEVLCGRLEEMGSLGVKSVVYSGEGEPLLHKDLPVFVKTAKDSGIDVAIVSNGTAGNGRLWENILPNLTWIKFSVDAGTPDVYAKVHNVSPSLFEKTLTSIREAVDVKKSNNLPVTIGIQYLALAENVHDLENALKIFSLLSIDYVVIKPFSLHPQMMNKKDTFYDQDIVKSIEEIVERQRTKQGMNIIFRKSALENYMKQNKHFTHCYALPFWGHITTSGDFYTCGVFIGNEDFRAGNIYEEGMEAIFYGAKRRKSIMHGESCLDISRSCRINCRMARVNEFLDLLNSKPAHMNFI